MEYTRAIHENLADFLNGTSVGKMLSTSPILMLCIRKTDPKREGMPFFRLREELEGILDENAIRQMIGYCTKTQELQELSGKGYRIPLYVLTQEAHDALTGLYGQMLKLD
ncbi:MAG: hypothetical protein ABIF10_07085 [Candidatus Woesearchaeota archaeon]